MVSTFVANISRYTPHTEKQMQRFVKMDIYSVIVYSESSKRWAV